MKKFKLKEYREELVKTQVPIYTIDDIEISIDFLKKNGLLQIGYGGGEGCMDKNKPWLVVSNDNTSKRYSEENFSIFFDNINK